MQTFSVIIPWKDRPELRHTLHANADLFARHDADVVISNCGGSVSDLERLIAEQRRLHDALKLRHVSYSPPAFSRSLANNIGASVSRGRVLFFLDADYVLRSDIFAQSRPLLDEGGRFVNIRTVHESEPRPNPSLSFLKEEINSRELICLDGRRAVLHAVSGGDGSGWGPGQLLVNRGDLLAIGGYNSALAGWGFEDTDVLLRLQFASGLVPHALGEAMHLSHGDRTRALRTTSRFDDSRRNLEICLENYRLGNHMGTYSEDIKAWQDALEVVPSWT